MSRMYLGALTALGLVVGMTSQANAQAFRGFRVEAQVGDSEFHAAGDKDSHIGWGGAAGADFDLGGFVLGAEGTFWWAPAEVHTIDGLGMVNHKTFQEWGVAARAGYLVTPGTLVYAKLGYVNNEQRKEFIPFAAPDGDPGSPATPGYYYHHSNHSGYVWGGGIDQQIAGGFYASLEGRYSRYNDHTHTITGLLGVGYLFGGALIANAEGTAVAYALWNLEERGPMFIDPGTAVYEGMVIGEHSRGNDLDVNVLKGKQLTNIRAAGKDEAVRLTPPRRMSLEQAIAYIDDDELVEVTPKSIRLRKRFLEPEDRKRARKQAALAAE
jgi:opacity protein-like surface antigen